MCHVKRRRCINNPFRLRNGFQGHTGGRISTVTGHLSGLKANQIARLVRLYRRRVPVDKVITVELAKTCAELSYELRRQIGLIINRRGNIESVIVGTDRQLVIPLLARSRSGPRLLRGVRFVHTHLHNQPLTKEDLTDLALLRLDLMERCADGCLGTDAADRQTPMSAARATLHAIDAPRPRSSRSLPVCPRFC